MRNLDYGEFPCFDSLPKTLGTSIVIPKITIKIGCPTCNSLVEPKVLYHSLHGEELCLTSQLITSREQLAKVNKKDALLRLKLEDQVAAMESELKRLKALVDIAGADHPHHYRR